MAVKTEIVVHVYRQLRTGRGLVRCGREDGAGTADGPATANVFREVCEGDRAQFVELGRRDS